MIFVKTSNGHIRLHCLAHMKPCKLIGPSLHCCCRINTVWLPSVKCQLTDQSLWRMTPIFPPNMCGFLEIHISCLFKCLWVIMRRQFPSFLPGPVVFLMRSPVNHLSIAHPWRDELGGSSMFLPPCVCSNSGCPTPACSVTQNGASLVLCAGFDIPYPGWSTCSHCILEEDAKKAQIKHSRHFYSKWMIINS